MNAASISPPEAIFGEIVKVTKKKIVDPSNTDLILKALQNKSNQKKTHVVLVLDEVDFLLNGLGNKKKRFDESTLGILLGWASDPSCGFTLIGISNSVGSLDARILHKHVKVRIITSLEI